MRPLKDWIYTGQSYGVVDAVRLSTLVDLQSNIVVYFSMKLHEFCTTGVIRAELQRRQFGFEDIHSADDRREISFTAPAEQVRLSAIVCSLGIILYELNSWLIEMHLIILDKWMLGSHLSIWLRSKLIFDLYNEICIITSSLGLRRQVVNFIAAITKSCSGENNSMECLGEGTLPPPLTIVHIRRHKWVFVGEKHQ